MNRTLAACAALVTVAVVLAGAAVSPAATPAAPGAVLQAFASAASRGEGSAVWLLLSSGTRARLGPRASFERRTLPALGRTLAALGSPRLALSEQINRSFAVGAIAGRARSYAAALQREHGVWKVVVAGPVRLHPVVPSPGKTVRRRTQIAAGIVGPAPIVEAGMWLDGRAFSANSGGTDDRHQTMWAEAPQPLVPGLHVVVAFAATDAGAGACTWVFRVAAENV